MAVIVLIGLALIGGAAAYRYETEEVTVKAKCEVSCAWPDHQGNKLLRTAEVEVTVPRWQANSVGIQEKREMCQSCLVKKEKEEQIARVKAAEEAEREEAKTKIPNLLGKNFKEVVSVLGEPSSVTKDLVSFHWVYYGRPAQDYSIKVDFLDHSYPVPRSQWLTEPVHKSDRVHLVVVTSKRRHRVSARAILPAKILNDPPMRIYLWPAYNDFYLYWLKGGKLIEGSRCDYKGFTYFAKLIVSGGDRQIYSLSQQLDINSGDYKKSYKVIADWKDCLVKELTQADGTWKRVCLDPGDGYAPSPEIIRIK